MADFSHKAERRSNKTANGPSGPSFAGAHFGLQLKSWKSEDRINMVENKQMANFLKSRKIVWLILAIRPKIGRKRLPTGQVDIRSCVRISVHLAHCLHYIFILISRNKNTKKTINNFFKFAFKLFGHIFMAL